MPTPFPPPLHWAIGLSLQDLEESCGHSKLPVPALPKSLLLPHPYLQNPLSPISFLFQGPDMNSCFFLP